jgi:hypothetical protein
LEQKVNGKNSKEDSRELLYYSAILDGQLDYEFSDQYYLLISQYLEKETFYDDFCWKFEENIRLGSDTVTTLQSNFILLSIKSEITQFYRFNQQKFSAKWQF